MWSYFPNPPQADLARASCPTPIQQRPLIFGHSTAAAAGAPISAAASAAVASCIAATCWSTCWEPMAHDWESTPDSDAFDHRLLEAHAAAMAHTLLAPTTYISAASDATAISDDEANISDAPAMAPANSDVATATFTAGAAASPKSDSDSDVPPHPAAGGEWAWEAAAGPGPDDPFTEDWPTDSDGLA
jgi:hypothetical protein